MSMILAYVFVGICSVILIIFAIKYMFKDSFCDHEYCEPPLSEASR